MFCNKLLKKIIFAALLTIPFNILCMKSIKKWEDVKEFSFKAVTYKTNSSYIGDEDNYKLSNKSDLFYGFISFSVDRWSGGQFGWSLHQILKPDSIRMNTALINSKLKDANLQMRLMNDNEKNSLSLAIRKDLAEPKEHSKRQTLLHLKTHNTFTKNPLDQTLKNFRTAVIKTKK